MDWREEGVLLTVRRHGESAAIIETFTRGQGRRAGLVRGGAGRRLAPVLQPGAQLSLAWRARLETHLGAFTVEPARSRAAQFMGDGDALAAVGAVAALLVTHLPEREIHADLYDATVALLDLVGADPSWPSAYARWEIALLADLGFGLDLSRCAATGGREDLIYVSPRSGRAVSRDAGAPYADRLLPLPRFLVEGGAGAGADVRDALRLSGWFLEEWAGRSIGAAAAPEARTRLARRLSRA